MPRHSTSLPRTAPAPSGSRAVTMDFCGPWTASGERKVVKVHELPLPMLSVFSAVTDWGHLGLLETGRA